MFEVIAEPRRRQILDLLRERERPVGELVDVLGHGALPLPQQIEDLAAPGFGDDLEHPASMSL